MNPMSTRFGAMTVRGAAFLVLLAMPFLPGCLGCGDETVEDDPTRSTRELDLPEELPDQPFGGTDTPIDTGQPTAEEIDPTPLGSQLEAVFFGYDIFELSADARAILAANARLMREREGRILVEGHCDERGTAPYNMSLGWKRANEVKRHLVSLGIAADRIETVSYGKEKPFVRGEGENVWSQNRRAHFTVPGR